MNLGEYIIYIFNFAVAISAVLAFLVIAYNGIKLLNSQGNPSDLSEAKKKIINSLLGLAVLLTSYILLTTINPELVNVKNVSIGNVSVTLPFFSPSKTETKDSFNFEEIPIGTLTESILAGTSSKKNMVPCYEYDIIGNPVDRNNDGKIDEKDIILDKDMFYCIKLLDDAIKRKTEVQLNNLIADLDKLMKTGCRCDRVYSGSFSLPWAEIKPSSGECGCESCSSNCQLCGAAHTGCPGAPGENLVDAELKQYYYDPCSSRQQIDCKRQEIKQLLDGTKPEDICFNKGWIDRSAPDKEKILTIKKGIERLEEFKKYFSNQVAELRKAEEKMKSPWGERLTLSEFHKIENEDIDKVITKSAFGVYDISRYCSEYKCVETATVEGNKVCVKGELSKEKRVCEIADKEYYFYEGDPATFYFSSPYNKNQETYPTEAKSTSCSVKNEDLKKEEYGGIIPIGETVDGAESYGEEVVKRIEKLTGEVRGIYNTGLAIYILPDSCNSGNCTAPSNCCYRPICGDCEGCCCPSVSYVSCYPAEPSETIPGKTVAYKGCSSFCGFVPDRPAPQEQYWVCPYRTFCTAVKDIYQRKTIDSSCFDDSEDKGEQGKRDNNRAQVGYIQKFEEREKQLFELAFVTKIKDDETAEVFDLISLVCPDYLNVKDNKGLTCDNSLSIKEDIENRFTLLEKLTLSRRRLLGCVTGYSFPYKEGASKYRVFSCHGGIDLMKLQGLVILPDFPYPVDDNYWNCYPMNSKYLTILEKGACHDNKDKERTDSNGPGCQEVIKPYMDNYYCCQ